MLCRNCFRANEQAKKNPSLLSLPVGASAETEVAVTTSAIDAIPKANPKKRGRPKKRHSELGNKRIRELKNIVKTVVTERKIVDDEDVDELITLFSPNKRQKLDSDNKLNQAKSNIQNLVNYLDNDIHLNKTDIVAVLTKDFCKDDILDITNTTMRTLQNKRRKLITRLNNKKLIKFTPKYDSFEFRVLKTHVKDVATVKSKHRNSKLKILEYLASQHNYNPISLISSLGQHDYKYTNIVWDLLPKQMLDKIQLDITHKRVYIWSDGALKTNNNIYTFLQLAQKYKCGVQLHFFAPQHGHNQVDAHFGNGKRHYVRTSLEPPNTFLKNHKSSQYLVI